MTDQFDRASELEELARQAALDRQAQKSAVNGISAFECEECGEPIPEARRLAIIGCATCVACQQELEKYGKTIFAQSRD